MEPAHIQIVEKDNGAVVIDEKNPVQLSDEKYAQIVLHRVVSKVIPGGSTNIIKQLLSAILVTRENNVYCVTVSKVKLADGFGYHICR
jgi:hypothetical protein